MVLEIWKALQDYPYCKVSNAGRVIKLNKGIWEECRYYIDKKGYISVSIRNSRSEFERIRVHRLVAMAFVEKPITEAILEVNHLDENPSNNRADNLEWVTHSENIIYSARRNPKRFNKRNNIPVVQIVGNEKIVKHWESISKASSSLNIIFMHIRMCCKYKPQYRKPVGGSWWMYESEWKIREKIMSGFDM